MPYQTNVTKEQLSVAPDNFNAQLTLKYLDYPAEIVGEESGLNPADFIPVQPEEARFLGLNVKSSRLPEPIFFGIRLHGDKQFMLEQADEIARGMIDRIADHSEGAAMVGLSAAAYMHRYVSEMNRIHNQEKGSDHTFIDPNTIGLMTALGSAFDQAAAELGKNGQMAASVVWQRELARIEREQTQEAPPATGHAANIPGPNGRHTPDSDLPGRSDGPIR